MDEKLKNIYKHMIDFGLSALTHANYHANYHGMYANPHWNELSVIQAAHAAEIFIKARIAQEHPLLIFEKMPTPDSNLGRNLELQDLFENGRTYQYQDLPDRLWATTGIQLPNITLYKTFGKLRNTVQHFMFPEGRDLGTETLNFVFNVIDPFICECWGLHAIDCNEDDVAYGYFIPSLLEKGILFTVSKDAANDIDTGETSYMEIEWPENNPTYKIEMLRRIKAAKNLP